MELKFRNKNANKEQEISDIVNSYNENKSVNQLIYDVLNLGLNSFCIKIIDNDFYLVLTANKIFCVDPNCKVNIPFNGYGQAVKYIYNKENGNLQTLINDFDTSQYEVQIFN